MKYKDYEGFKDADHEEMEKLIDVRGAMRTESLFIEVIQAVSKAKYEPIYSLKCKDSRGYPSAYQIYMASIDETDAALKLVGNLAHWRKLCRLNWFLKGKIEHGFEGIESWRKDMSDRDRSEAKRVILTECKENNVTAARALDKMAIDSAKRIPKSTRGTGKASQEDSTIVELIGRHKS